MMGDELGSATNIDRLFVHSRTAYIKFHLDREQRFLELPYEFRAKISAKISTFGFSWISGREIESDSQNV